MPGELTPLCPDAVLAAFSRLVARNGLGKVCAAILSLGKKTANRRGCARRQESSYCVPSCRPLSSSRAYGLRRLFFWNVCVSRRSACKRNACRAVSSRAWCGLDLITTYAPKRHLSEERNRKCSARCAPRASLVYRSHATPRKTPGSVAIPLLGPPQSLVKCVHLRDLGTRTDTGRFEKR